MLYWNHLTGSGLDLGKNLLLHYGMSIVLRKQLICWLADAFMMETSDSL
jgi:hypothetical protein